MGGLTSHGFSIIRNQEDTGVMRVIRSLVSGLIVSFLLGLLAFARSSRTEAFILSIERVKHAVVPVLCGRFDDKKQLVVQLIDGTGFFIDSEGRFATAAHVIKGLSVVNAQQPFPCVWAIYVPDDGWQRDAVTFPSHWFLFGNCEMDEALDLAVCKTVLVPKGVEPMFIEDSRPPDGSPVAFTGFPLGSIEPLSSRGDIATYRGALDKEGSREMVIDKEAWPGASGSPVYGEDGGVLGIVLQRGLGDGVGIAIARPSHFIATFLRSKSIAVASHDDKKKRKY